MNSDQERALFLQYGWHYDHVGRKWVNHDGTAEIGVDLLVEVTQQPEGDFQLMRAIVHHGKRTDLDSTNESG